MFIMDAGASITGKLQESMNSQRFGGIQITCLSHLIFCVPAKPKVAGSNPASPTMKKVVLGTIEFEKALYCSKMIEGYHFLKQYGSGSVKISRPNP